MQSKQSEHDRRNTLEKRRPQRDDEGMRGDVVVMVKEHTRQPRGRRTRSVAKESVHHAWQRGAQNGTNRARSAPEGRGYDQAAEETVIMHRGRVRVRAAVAAQERE